MELLKQFPYFAGKKLLYVHGFGSSGQSNTPRLLRQMLPEATVLAPDLPIHPAEALSLLQALCAEEQPAVIMGTSMGGMYAEMLRGYDRILVNPAFELYETLRTNVGLGKVTFFSARQDGVQEFMLTKTLLEEYRDIARHNFDGAATEAEQAHVFGLFGRQDPLVHTAPVFCRHYRQYIPFEGEHRLNDSVLLHSVMPVLGRIHIRQSGKEPPVLHIHTSALLRPDGSEVSEARAAVERLAQRYEVYLVGPQCGTPADTELSERLTALFGVPVWNRIILTNHLRLLLGDYLIAAPYPASDADDFLGTRLAFGSPDFKSWEDFLIFFDRLGGQ